MATRRKNSRRAAIGRVAGVSVFMQAWAPDPNSNALGVAMTNAAKVTLGH